MTITIKCECGNEITLSTLPRKYLQLRDNLEDHQFRYDGAEIKDGQLKEIRIKCSKCGNYASLGVD